METATKVLDLARKVSDEIAQLETEYLSQSEVVKADALELQMIEGALREQINLAQTEDKKPRYTNDSQRTAALLALKAQDKNWQTALNDHSQAEGIQARCRIEIDRLHREYTLRRLEFEALAIGRRI